MKYIIAFIVLISLVFCDSPFEKYKLAEKIYKEVKKHTLECVAKSGNASDNLRNYANNNLKVPFTEQVSLSRFLNNETDRGVISNCRNKAFNSVLINNQ